jgi:transcriptional regulator with XRE-family HTH domain
MEAVEFGEFSVYFSKLRKLKGFKSQRRLAIASGVSNGTIARIESGIHEPTPDTLRLLSKALDCTHIGMMIIAGHITEGEVLTYRQANGVNDLFNHSCI